MTELELARQAEFDRAAEQIAEAIERPNTRAAFTQDWATWERYCATEGIPPSTVSPSVLVGFVTWLAHTPDYPGAAPATITRRLSGVLDGWRRRGITAPRGITRQARATISAYERDIAVQGLQVGRGKAPALTIRDLRRISEEMPDSLDGIRDRAVLMVGFGCAARRSEIAGILQQGIELDGEGLVVTIPDSKTGARTVAVPYGTHELTCPVRCWMNWRTALLSQDISDGKAFRRIRHGKILDGMSGKAIGELISRAAERAGIEKRITGHSVRSGLATEARRAGHDVKVIAEQGGWTPNSRSLYGYMQTVDRWTDNAVKGIGL